MPPLGARAGLGPPEVFLDQIEAVLRDQEVRVGEDVSNVQVAGQDDLGAAQVFERAADHVVRRRQDHQRGVVEADRCDQVGCKLGSRLLEAEGFLVIAIRPPTVPAGTARISR